MVLNAVILTIKKMYTYTMSYGRSIKAVVDMRYEIWTIGPRTDQKLSKLELSSEYKI